ncbi:unnamed protein product [Strongylus vulgaris]|uniref:Uncharacterized protein n=1 Tax=Strongylus vulgaris TaxID=40348 RepID=A0A3P7IFS5_STRVU|nr:unnamed protein product [Strongylus vulgaris]
MATETRSLMCLNCQSPMKVDVKLKGTKDKKVCGA